MACQNISCVERENGTRVFHFKWEDAVRKEDRVLYEDDSPDHSKRSVEEVLASAASLATIKGEMNTEISENLVFFDIPTVATTSRNLDT